MPWILSFGDRFLRKHFWVVWHALFVILSDWFSHPPAQPPSSWGICPLVPGTWCPWHITRGVVQCNEQQNKAFMNQQRGISLSLRSLVVSPSLSAAYFWLSNMVLAVAVWSSCDSLWLSQDFGLASHCGKSPDTCFSFTADSLTFNVHGDSLSIFEQYHYTNRALYLKECSRTPDKVWYICGTFCLRDIHSVTSTIAVIHDHCFLIQ